ncbi:hypothetical protein E3J48_01695 [Candidatus Aerophobetes bacterium]|uniref:Uncharacterized protein n=1 Tax=Aerophobetes bacterium TaxID=2030807 RepID=A0A523WAH7_UNCAE|nr:MAG: hypothetical protein E3J48_01695 [Candidatus Aerophobetes bacterium]
MLVIRSWRTVMRMGWKNLIKTKKGKALIMIGALVIVLVIMIVGLEVTTSPKFCSTCHNMKPYYESWKTSSHNEVNCIKCHAEPGIIPYLKTKANGLVEVAIYLSGNLPTRYDTEVSDKTCLREDCHTQAKLKQEKVDFKKGIPFEHETHLQTLRGEFRLRCTSCHSQIVQSEHMSVAESTCFTCHFKGEDPNQNMAECILCHGALGEIPEAEAKFNHQAILQMGVDCLSCHKEVVKGKGEVHREKCLFCHAEPSRLERFKESSFLHLKHVSEHKVECFQCHDQIKHGVEEWPLSFP